MADDYLQTADVWTVLDLIVAEWTSDPTSVACFDLRLVERAKVLVEARRKQSTQEAHDQAFVVFSQAFADYMTAIGFTALVAANPRVRGVEGPGVANFLFEMEFTGRRTKPPTAKLLLPSDGGVH